MVSRGVHIELNHVRSGSLSPRDSLGGSGPWPFFFQPLLWCISLHIIYPFLADPGPPSVDQAGAYSSTRPISRLPLLFVSCNNRNHTVQVFFLINMVRTFVDAFNAKGMYLP